MVKNFKDLIVWQKSVDLAVKIYTITEKFPVAEKFGLCSQINRASVSVSSNIAEGSQRSTTKDYLNFLNISKGSLAELETQLCIAFRLKLITKERYNEIVLEILEIQKILSSIIYKLKAKTTNNP